jgi:DNA processing protein
MSRPRIRDLTRGSHRDELIATVAILRSEAIPPTKLSGLLDYLGSAVDLLPVPLGGTDVGSRPLLIEGIGAPQIASAEDEVDQWELAGLDVRTVLDATYPTNLQAVFNKPPLIFVAGQWDDEPDSRAIAVVGTRSASAQGEKRAYRLAQQLARARITVISGMAKGIDAAAHRGALSLRGRTVAVMGTGIARRYPKENTELADQILASGCALLSQFFPAQPPTRWAFPVRNVTMSGLSLATVVVEAGATSGAKMQAEAALTHGRSVFLPSSLVASHDWARAMVEQGFKGARAIEVASPEEVVEHLELPPAASTLVA